MTSSEGVDSALKELNSLFRAKIAETGRVGFWLNHVPSQAEGAISLLFESGVPTLPDWPTNRWTDGVTILRMLSTVDGDIELRAVLWWGPADDIEAGLTPEYIHGWFRLFREDPRIRDFTFRIGDGNNALLFTTTPPN
ncbi:MAG: hypothetical protein AB7P14_08515 [Blastocatellales bacterium]